MGNSPAQIFTKFDDSFKKGNIEGLKRTYFGVLLLIELNSKTSKIAKNIREKIESLISSNEGENKSKGLEKNLHKQYEKFLEASNCSKRQGN